MYVANGNAGGQAGFNGTAGPDGCRRLVIDKKPISLVYARAMVMRLLLPLRVRFTARGLQRVLSFSLFLSRHRHREIVLFGTEDQWMDGHDGDEPCRAEPTGAY